MLSAYSSEHFWVDVFELWKFFFEVHLILDVKTIFRLQKPHWETFDGNTLKMKAVVAI